MFTIPLPPVLIQISNSPCCIDDGNSNNHCPPPCSPMVMISPPLEISWCIIVYSFTIFANSLRFVLLEFLSCYFSAGMVARASGNSNLDGDDGQPDAPIQQRIVSPSIPMIMADAAGTGGKAVTGGATEVVENLPTPDVLPMRTEVVDDGQPDAPIQQQIASPSIPVIVANTAGNGGRAETGGRQRRWKICPPWMCCQWWQQWPSPTLQNLSTCIFHKRQMAIK